MPLLGLLNTLDSLIHKFQTLVDFCEIQSVSERNGGPRTIQCDIDLCDWCFVRPFPQPLSDSAALTDRRKQIFGQGLQQSECFNKVGLAR